jgi:hypothetical protein
MYPRFMHPFKILRSTWKIGRDALPFEPQTVDRVERGTLTPSNNYLKALAFALTDAGYTFPTSSTGPVGVLLNAHTEWVIEHRKLARPVLNRKVTIKLGYNPQTHPFTLWRVALVGPNRYAFCNLLALHPYTVEYYEKGQSAKFPSAIWDALSDAAVDPELIDYLVAACKAFSDYWVRREPIPNAYL